MNDFVEELRRRHVIRVATAYAVTSWLILQAMSARLHQARGRILLGQLDDPDEAVEAFQQARSAAPEWTAPILALGDANITRGRYADGIEWYLRAMELDPRDNELPAITARRYFELGLDDEGVAMLDRARALAPGAEWTRSIELGRELRAGNHERAASLAEQMLRDDVSNRGSAFIYAAIGYALANAAVAQGDLETAIGHALADLRRPLGVQTNWRLRYRGVAWLEPVVADERVAARLAALDDETAQARGAVRAMLAQRTGR